MGNSSLHLARCSTYISLNLWLCRIFVDADVDAVRRLLEQVGDRRADVIMGVVEEVHVSWAIDHCSATRVEVARGLHRWRPRRASRCAGASVYERAARAHRRQMHETFLPVLGLGVGILGHDLDGGAARAARNNRQHQRPQHLIIWCAWLHVEQPSPRASYILALAGASPCAGTPAERASGRPDTTRIEGLHSRLQDQRAQPPHVDFGTRTSSTSLDPPPPEGGPRIAFRTELGTRSSCTFFTHYNPSLRLLRCPHDQQQVCVCVCVCAHMCSGIGACP